jgi:hypothetical protein
VLPADDGLLHWDGFDRTLAEHVSGYFGEVDWGNGPRVRRLAACPRIIRMRYTSKNNRLRFHHDLSRFEYQLIPGHAEGIRSVVYRCVAAIRLRDSPEGADSVRLYYYDLHFVPKRAPPMSDAWQLPDPGEYMLYYAPSEIPLPEESCMPHPRHSRYGSGLHGMDRQIATHRLVAASKKIAAAHGQDKTVATDRPTTSAEGLPSTPGGGEAQSPKAPTSSHA